MPKPMWGLVATIKASSNDTLNWAAHHLELGASRLHVYLDRPDATAEAALAAHPRVTVITTDDTYWKMRRPKETHQRPPAHQGRQFANAKWAYMHADTDWLGHIDVDEFIMSANDLPGQLEALDEAVICARLHPVEALASEGQDIPRKTVYAKSCARLWLQRLEETAQIYPTFGAQLNGGYLSHVAGKLFVRTGIEGLKLHIHNVERADGGPVAEAALEGPELLHLHAHKRNQWLRLMEYRLRKGSYRPELSPPTQPPGAPMMNPAAVNLNTLFSRLAQDPGGLEAFYDEVCLASPRLRAALKARGHLRQYEFDPAAARRRIFGA